MKIYVGQIKVEYNYNPLGRYYNLWFYQHNKCIFTATLFNTSMFIDAIREVGDCLRYKGLQTYKVWIPETHELVIEGRM